MGPRILACLLAAVLAASASTAFAQSDEELARARAAFGEGVTALEQQQWPTAAERFREVLAVRATSQVKYNLAIALEHMGEIAEAARLLAEVIQDQEFDRRIRRQARSLLESVVPRLARITIQIDGDAGGVVFLDGVEVSPDRVGHDIPVDPGEHRVELRRSGRAVANRTVTLTAGQAEEVSLAGGNEAPPSAGGAPPPLDEELLRTRDRERNTGGGGDITGEWWFWTIIGVGVLAVAGAVVGIVFATSGQAATPVQGNLMPGTIEVTFP